MVTEQNLGQRVRRTAEFEFSLDAEERGLRGRLRHVIDASFGYVEWNDGTANCIDLVDLEVAS